MRADLERMLNQIEAETAAAGVHGGKGRLTSVLSHSLARFASGTSCTRCWNAFYHRISWPSEGPSSELSEEERSAGICKASVDIPGFVSLYCGVKLGQMVHLAVASIIHQLRDYKFDHRDWQASQIYERNEFHGSGSESGHAHLHVNSSEIKGWGP